MLLDMRTLSQAIRERRSRRGSLELSMPEPVLEYDDKGHVSGAHFAAHDDSHQLIEEFMLAANEAVAEHFDQTEGPVPAPRPPGPGPAKAGGVREFARTLGYKLPRRPTASTCSGSSNDRPRSPSGTPSTTPCCAA